MDRFVALFLAALLPSSCALRPDSSAGRGPLQSELRVPSAEFALTGHREIKAIYSVRNAGKQSIQLDFPTAQHMELTLRSPNERLLFLWSEDRLFSSAPSVTVINPGERLEYEASVPTRDMVAGQVYPLEAIMVGYPETKAVAELRPR